MLTHPPLCGQTPRRCTSRVKLVEWHHVSGQMEAGESWRRRLRVPGLVDAGETWRRRPRVSGLVDAGES